ncbi:MAG: hypothetical protein GXY46_06455 [Actinobacteria bacterium]|nr:hypothetical protein [Actinomycetota bacterium]
MEPKAQEAVCRGSAHNLMTSVDGALYVCMSAKQWATVSWVLAEASGLWSDTIIPEEDRSVVGGSD